MKNLKFSFYGLLLFLLLCVLANCGQKKEKADVKETKMVTVEEEKIPEAIMNALVAKFPQAEIEKWTKEKEDTIVVYDVEFKQADQKFEADIKEDGSIHNWEKEITYQDLPDTVRKVMEVNYPVSTIAEVMEITTVTDGMDILEGYEILFTTTDQKDMEVTISPAGAVLEEPEGTD